ncbi:MAG: DUF3237 domain-containing protein [Solirubrobacteraceae bacterium]
MTPAEPLNTQLLFTLTGTVGAPSEIGVLPQGRRRIIPIEGGEFEGPRIRGQVLPFGADWMLIRPDGVAVIDVRATLQTDDDALIYMHYSGYRHGPTDVMQALADGEDVDPATYYFRIAVILETGAEQYSWLNRIVAVGTGHRIPEGPIYDVYEVL